ncbi:hypothetical protein ABPG77_001873 [Micractinium sp. CCAP 211/92]
MVGSPVGPETVFYAEGCGAFWATTYRTGHYSSAIVLRESATGKVLLCARSGLGGTWNVCASNNEAIVTVAATRRRKYGKARFKLTVYPAFHSEPAIKVKPDAADPRRITLWAVTGRRCKAQEGEVMATAVYSSYTGSSDGAVWRSLSSVSSNASSGGASSRRSAGSARGTSTRGGSPVPSPLRPSPVGDTLWEAAEEITAAEDAPAAKGCPAVRQEGAGAAAAAAEEAAEAEAVEDAYAAFAPHTPTKTPRAAAREAARSAAALATARAGVAADAAPGDCSFGMHAKANAPLVCCLLAIHRSLLAPRSLAVSFEGLEKLQQQQLEQQRQLDEQLHGEQRLPGSPGQA